MNKPTKRKFRARSHRCGLYIDLNREKDGPALSVDAAFMWQKFSARELRPRCMFNEGTVDDVELGPVEVAR